ncbi:hypothetical protein AWB82_06259 [Caballeronia glebae]|uniref:Uncharacterized protein n=1 Tax=Caballeronia glebae TaxID=1777143 RepID=A0A158D3Z9_9BURK|nr:hypothetical protein [Caballeronia glebae]SAK89362.1 hypothetical protein AWB82_06259 [Caballeronia glebae]
MDEPSEIISVQHEEGGWIWSITVPDPAEHRMKLFRQSARACATYEAELALEELRAADAGNS